MSDTASLLVVDDHELNRDALSRRLRQRGYYVELAEDGEQALTMIARGTFDLILLDIEMPTMSGLEVLKRVRAQYSQTALPVIMVTARSEGQDIVEALELGANDYVTKPIDFPVALARINTHLAHKRAVSDLKASEERYDLAIRGANDGIWDWDLLTQEVHWSPRWKTILGLEAATVSDHPNEWFLRVHPDDIGRVQQSLEEHLTSGTGHYECEHRIRFRDDSYRWVLCRGAAVRNESGIATRLVGSLTDITQAKLADALTGLPNRFLFLDVVERAIKRTERRKDYAFAILVLALDRLRVIHASLGPQAADQLLVDVARRLHACLRATDVLTRDEPGFTLARLGGDEFNVLIDDVADVNHVVAVSERLCRALEAPFEINGQQVFASARVGIAVSTTGYRSADEILRDATTALARVQSGASKPIEIFDIAMRQRAMSRLSLETDLRHAIEERAFELHYQPIVSLDSGRIEGFEALLRWRHPQRGLIQPAEFIQIAEDTGMIIEIGRFTLAESCKQMASWLADFGAAAPHVMCANVSTKELSNTGLMTEIAATLRATGLTPENLKLEITESAFINDLSAVQVTLHDARALGVTWSLDDFGTGYSSLSFLHRLKVDTVKVDQSFVKAMGAGGNGSDMVRAIVGLAHTLGMEVVAEGVETAEQASELLALGCEYAQGFHFSRAVDTAAAARLIESQPWQSWRKPAAVQ